MKSETEKPKPKRYFKFKMGDFLAEVEGFSNEVIMVYLQAIVGYVEDEAAGIENTDEAMHKACKGKRIADLKDWPEVKRRVFDNDRTFKLGPDGKWHLPKDKFWHTRYGKIMQVDMGKGPTI